MEGRGDVMNISFQNLMFLIIFEAVLAFLRLPTIFNTIWRIIDHEHVEV